MILITSGALITPEMQAELGPLPPAFVPLGNKRLYEHQQNVLSEAFPGEDIYLSLPDSFSVSSSDHLMLEKLRISVVRIPAKMSLGESLLFVINTIGRYDENMRILHGDTLIIDNPQEVDVIALSTSSDVYPWEIESRRGGADDLIWCGYFAFSDIRSLARALALRRGKFVEAVRDYESETAVHLVRVEKWHDLGHVNTYYRTRAAVTTQRVFNNLRIESGIVRKSSWDHYKIAGEWRWYEQLPHALKRHTPQPIRYADGTNREPPFYELEYLPCMPLNELFVFCNLSQAFWGRIFVKIGQLMQLFGTAVTLSPAQRHAVSLSHRELVLDKTRARLQQFFAAQPSDMHCQARLNGQLLPRVADIIEECSEATLALPVNPGVSHGDLCLSNLLYDARSDVIKMLDPRGMDHAGAATSLGDLSYDYAKLVHSIVGSYDHIIAGRYVLTQEGPLAFSLDLLLDNQAAALRTQFCKDFQLNGVTVDRIIPLTILLFFSMLPLHSDAPARQQALLANAFRLYSDWKGH